jgi:hypothetical protein
MSKRTTRRIQFETLERREVPSGAMAHATVHHKVDSLRGGSGSIVFTNKAETAVKVTLDTKTLGKLTGTGTVNTKTGVETLKLKNAKGNVLDATVQGKIHNKTHFSGAVKFTGGTGIFKGATGNALVLGTENVAKKTIDFKIGGRVVLVS